MWSKLLLCAKEREIRTQSDTVCSSIDYWQINGFSYYRFSDLFIINGTVNSNAYVNILK